MYFTILLYTGENPIELITLKSQQSKYYDFLFNLTYLPFSRFREKIEFKLLHVLFKETFPRLPEDFSFNLYLSKSFEQYSLKIMDYGTHILCYIVYLHTVLI